VNWDAIGAIGEIIGALAVVATLGYLAVQIRQNTKTARSAARQAISDAATLPAQNFFGDANFRKAFNAHVNGEEVDEDQMLHLQSYCYINFRLWENIHYQYRSGMLTADEWDSFRRNLKAISQIPIWQDYWEREGDVYTDSFRAEMNSILGEIADEPRSLPKSVIHPRSERDDT